MSPRLSDLSPSQPMDTRLQEKLMSWHRQIDVLSKLEEVMRQLEAAEKPLWSELFLKAEGKNVAEREAMAFADPGWIDFAKGLATARTAWNRERMSLELKIKAYESTYLTIKREDEAMRKHA